MDRKIVNCGARDIETNPTADLVPSRSKGSSKTIHDDVLGLFDGAANCTAP
ncbi:hypothetical protein GCM10025859_08150 [Alicyclobacillus fastidiosus]|nr:hypothetical protein GCM10025859_08150 [Alicyclobacillus fastidiosus]